MALSGRMPWATLTITGFALGAAWWPGALAALALDRECTFPRQLWRLWTGHLVHFNGEHLGWNLLVLATAGTWAEGIAGGPVRIFYLITPAVISVSLLIFDPALGVYAGLSGVAAGVLTFLAVRQLCEPARADRWFWWSVLALIIAKIALEKGADRSLFASLGAGVRAVPLAHLVGAACGAVIARRDDGRTHLRRE